MAKKVEEKVDVTTLKLVVINVPIRNMGGSSMIQNKFSEAAGKKIKDKVTGQVVQKNAPIKPEEVFKAAQYKTRDGKLGVGANAIKASMVAAANNTGLKMTQVKKDVFIIGDIIPFTKNKKPVKREDFLPNPTTKGRQLTVRAEIETWEMVVSIRFDENTFSKKQVCTLLSRAGFHCGLYEERPNGKCGPGGNHGQFELSRPPKN